MMAPHNRRLRAEGRFAEEADLGILRLIEKQISSMIVCSLPHMHGCNVDFLGELHAMKAKMKDVEKEWCDQQRQELKEKGVRDEEINAILAQRLQIHCQN